MGGVVQGALGSASNMLGGLPIVGGMARQGLGQAGSMLGMPQQQGGQPGGQGGGLFGGSKGGGQGGPGGMLGGLMGGGKGGGQQNPFSQFAQGAAQFGNGQNPFTGQRMNMGFGAGGGGGGQSPGFGNNFGMAPQSNLANQRIQAARARGYQPMGQAPGAPPNPQTASMSTDFMNQYK